MFHITSHHIFNSSRPRVENALRNDILNKNISKPYSIKEEVQKCTQLKVCMYFTIK